MQKKFKGFKAKKNNTGMKLAIGAAAAVVFILLGLGSVVVMDNDKICDKIGLSGFIFDTCYGKPGQSFDKIAIVVGNTANTPEPVFTKDVKGYIAASLMKEESIDVYSVTPDRKKFYIDSAIDEDENLEGKVESVSQIMSDLEKKIKTPPTTSGANYLEAIIRASRNMALSDKEKGVIVVMGSGLSDGGLLDFAKEPLLDANPDALMERYDSGDNPVLPKKLLRGITIVWSGLGRVAQPQEELLPHEMNNLEEIYKKIFSKNSLGADNFVQVKGSDDSQSIKTNKTVKTAKTSRATTLDESKVEFKANSDELADKETAIRALSAVINNLRLFESESVVIEGYVGLASCNSKPDVSLSQKRAETVKRLFSEQGVSEDRIEAIGRGKGPKNECKNGRYDKGISIENRIVKVTIKK